MENQIFKRGKNSKNYSEIRIDPKNSTDDNIPVVICGISLQVQLLIGQLTIVNVIDFSLSDEFRPMRNQEKVSW